MLARKEYGEEKLALHAFAPTFAFFVWPEKKLDEENLALSLVPGAAVVLLALGGLVFLLLAHGGLGLLLVVTVLFAPGCVPAGRGLRGRVVLVHLGRAAGGPSPLDAVVQALFGDEDGEDAGGEMMKKKFIRKIRAKVRGRRLNFPHLCRSREGEVARVWSRLLPLVVQAVAVEGSPVQTRSLRMIILNTHYACFNVITSYELKMYL